MPIMLQFKLFPNDADSLNDPRVVAYREHLEEGCKIFGGKLTTFAIDQGVVAFTITSDEFANEIMQMWEQRGVKVEVIKDQEEATRKGRKMIEENRKKPRKKPRK